LAKPYLRQFSAPFAFVNVWLFLLLRRGVGFAFTVMTAIGLFQDLPQTNNPDGFRGFGTLICQLHFTKS
jgi:hypothetical protein